MTSTVESLPAKWRNFLASAHNLTFAQICMRDMARDCADQLEAALAAQPKEGELLASLLNRPNRVWRSESETGTEELARGIVIDPIELRTLASRRVTVDDEMVERACVGMSLGIEADGEWPKDYPDDEQAIIRNGMRAALTAALQPDSGEG